MFEIQAALEESEGEGANFYSFMGLKPSASLQQIRKAYRERSLEWQYVSIRPVFSLTDHAALIRTQTHRKCTVALSASA